jgi:GNAT superfamily N-acetyltransferase
MAMTGYEVTFHSDLGRVDWVELTQALIADDFDNGRTPDQLQQSFANSHSCCFAEINGRLIAKARVLSDGVCNAYLVDVWTHSDYRRQGISTTLLQRLLAGLEGQHVYLQADDPNLDFYRNRGFHEQPHGLSLVVGQWLVKRPVR